MDITFKTGLDIDEREFLNVLKLDVTAYGDDIITSPGLALARYAKNRDSIICAYDGDKLVGFWCFFPVTKEFKDLCYNSDKVWDDDVRPENIAEYNRGEIQSIFAIDLVVAPEYRGRGIAKCLMEEFRHFLRLKIDKGYQFDKVFGFAITEQGLKVMRNYDAREVSERESGILFEFCARRFTNRPVEIKDGSLNAAEAEEAASVLATAFFDDPLYRALFKDIHELQAYCRLCVEYFLKEGEVHVAHINDEVVALALWMPHGSKIMGPKNLITRGFLPAVIRFAGIISHSSLSKLYKEYVITERKRYQEPHHYLAMLGSVYEGAGGAVLAYGLEKFKNLPVFLENSNFACNQTFYNKYGIVPFECITVLGVEVCLMLAEKQSDDC